MSLAYFPMFPTDFDADTGHLSFAEDGCYNRLLRLAWRCPEAKMPDDLDWICRKARAVTAEDRALVEAILAEFFTRKSGKVFQNKLVKIWAEANAAHAKRVEAGRSGGHAKSLKTKSSQPSNAIEMPEQSSSNQNQNQKEDLPEGRSKKAARQDASLPPPEIETPPSVRRPAARGTRLSTDWVLPKSWGDWAVSIGLTAAEVRDQADRFRDYWVAKSGRDAAKTDWEATWRNWARRVKDDMGRSANGRGQPFGQPRSDPASIDRRLAALASVSVKRVGHDDADRDQDQP